MRDNECSIIVSNLKSLKLLVPYKVLVLSTRTTELSRSRRKNALIVFALPLDPLRFAPSDSLRVIRLFNSRGRFRLTALARHQWLDDTFPVCATGRKAVLVDCRQCIMQYMKRGRFVKPARFFVHVVRATCDVQHSVTFPDFARCADTCQYRSFSVPCIRRP